MLHALARRYYTCGAKHCPGNQVVKIKRGAKLIIVKPDGTKLVYQLKQRPNRFAPSNLSEEQIAHFRSDLGPTTVTLTACNPVTYHKKPKHYRHRVTATFVLVGVIPPKQ